MVGYVVSESLGVGIFDQKIYCLNSYSNNNLIWHDAYSVSLKCIFKSLYSLEVDR